MTRRTRPLLPAYDTLTEALAAAVRRLNIRSAPASDLFDTIDAVSDGLPLVRGFDDWTSDRCATCAQGTMDAALQAGCNGHYSAPWMTKGPNAAVFSRPCAPALAKKPNRPPFGRSTCVPMVVHATASALIRAV